MNSSLRLGLALFLGLFSLAQAQPRHGDHDQNRRGGRVVLYSEANFHGDSIVLYAGDEVKDLATRPFEGGAQSNDRISSILIEGRVEVAAYADSWFRGDVLQLNESVPNLADIPGPNRRGNWNDLISSVRVIGMRDRGHTEEPPRRRNFPDGGERREARGPRVELYSDAGYAGPRLILVPGDRIRNLGDVGFDDGSEANDSISSIRVIGDVSVTAYEDADFRGASVRLTESVPNLAFRMGRGHSKTWNDTISSLVVTRNDGPPPEEIVRRAYRDILGREADAGGLAAYVRAMKDEGWTEEQVRDALKSSEEYRNNHRPRH